MAIGFWGLQLLTVGFRGPSVALFSRYSYWHYCACRLLSIQMYGAGVAVKWAARFWGPLAPYPYSDMGPGGPMSLEI